MDRDEDSISRGDPINQSMDFLPKKNDKNFHYNDHGLKPQIIEQPKRQHDSGTYSKHLEEMMRYQQMAKQNSNS